MICDLRPQDGTGTAITNLIVQGRGGHGWQPFEHINDNGIDGIIIKRKKGVDTGEIIYVQIKCGSDGGYFKETQNRPHHFGVNVGEEYISKHRPRWDRLISGVILVYVDYKSLKAWWTDLKDEKSYSPENKSIILVPKAQRFGIHSFGEFKKLEGYLHINHELTTLTLEKDDFRYFNFTQTSIKGWAKDFYRNWAESSNRNNPVLGEVIVSREGWRHITRTGRKPERIIQSWNLLGVAKKIIQEVDKIHQLRFERSESDELGNYVIIDFISLRAQVLFSFRHSSIVQVILKRTLKFNSNNDKIENKIRFYSVFEPFNGEKLR